MSLTRFSIRQLLLLVTFVAIALGVWLERRNRLGGPAPYQLQIAGENAQVLDTTTGQITGKKPTPPQDFMSLLNPTPPQRDKSVLDLIEQRE